MSGLEDKILAALGRAASTWDGLRGALGATPGELDEAIHTLERAKAIHRDRGRFYLNGAHHAAPATAEATTNEGDSMTTKTCSHCHKDKGLDDFPKKGAQCKACISEKAAAAYQAKRKASAPAPAKRVKRAARVSSTPPLAPRTSGPLGILHFADGVRVGPMHASASGIMQFLSFIDLSAAQLDELTTWWAAAKASA